jgi:AbrB family looped-hinge helix DNA binding protein
VTTRVADYSLSRQAPEACTADLTASDPSITISTNVIHETTILTTETTMTIKGQVTVPREIRERLGLQAGDRMAFTLLSDGTVIMRPKTRRLADLAGSLTRPGQPKVPVKDMRLPE